MKLTVRVEDNGLYFCFVFYFHLFSYLGLSIRVSVTSHVTVTVITHYLSQCGHIHHCYSYMIM